MRIIINKTKLPIDTPEQLLHARVAMVFAGRKSPHDWEEPPSFKLLGEVTVHNLVELVFLLHSFRKECPELADVLRQRALKKMCLPNYGGDKPEGADVVSWDEKWVMHWTKGHSPVCTRRKR